MWCTVHRKLGWRCWICLSGTFQAFPEASLSHRSLWTVSLLSCWPEQSPRCCWGRCVRRLQTWESEFSDDREDLCCTLDSNMQTTYILAQPPDGFWASAHRCGTGWHRSLRRPVRDSKPLGSGWLSAPDPPRGRGWTRSSEEPRWWGWRWRSGPRGCDGAGWGSNGRGCSWSWCSPGSLPGSPPRSGPKARVERGSCFH